MTGEQKPGGLEVVAFRWKGFDGYYVVGLGQPKPYDAEALTPAEPAEARIRELEEEVRIEASAVQAMASQLRARATAAEAKLAKAKEALSAVIIADNHRPRGLGTPSDWVRNSHKPAIDHARQTLAALQQEGE